MNSRRRNTLLQRGLYGSYGTFPLHLLSPFSLPTLFTRLKLPSSGLEFTAIALSQNIASSTEELSDSFRASYGKTLKPHHSFLIKPMFSAAMSACPYRKDFYGKLGDDEEKVTKELRVWLAALETLIAILKGFLDRKEAKW